MCVLGEINHGTQNGAKGLQEETVSFTIVTDVSLNPENLLRFIYQSHSMSLKENFTNVSQKVVDHNNVLSFTVVDPKGTWQLEMNVEVGHIVKVKMVPVRGLVPQETLDQMKDDFVATIGLYAEKLRGSTLHFAWVTGEKSLLEKETPRRRRIASRIFFENMYFLFVIFIGVSIIAFMILGSIYAPMVLVVSQFLLVLFSDKIIARMGEWSVTDKKHTVHILKYQLLPEEAQVFQQKYSKGKLLEIKSEIYKETLAVGKPVDAETAGTVLSKHGFKCIPQNLSSKTVNVYDIVKNAAGKFNLPLPKIVIANTMLPNAAASGPSPSHGIVLITTGLLVRLDTDEILSVVGHEFSHLKARDPMVLLGIVSSEYLLRVYLFWPFIAYFGLIYLLFSLGMVFFVAKFFEARADLDSALKIGQSKTLAMALRKMGYRKLKSERSSASRIQSWLSWDPHPPIYFRISRLEKLELSQKIEHTLIRSIMDNFRGIYEALH